ncbi:hypothetical protein BO94DRAFT_619760 [Aspergillus sclerotioniger CBS 115572]|uniref:Uncharacterized protein n=1 Tax=Aspergillus sclerotioniger CBS 115572 TaxID=1450535 RepID=A0A317XGY7_9EURO|nr:hypothetical protein BO94DRAFT_619760 [Aspergillus sclerotioniger CBS 115572]PWY96668.1 hypothetical protein BO94DRAFT_619760 [Aspergillus sclerotioniger CBS 115572]
MSTLIQNPDYVPSARTSPLALKLYDQPWDDDNDALFIKHTLEFLVTGQITPQEAATTIDTHITTDCATRHTALMARPDPRNLTPEEEAQNLTMYQIAPNPKVWMEMFFKAITKLCSAFPPYHAGQNALVEMFQILHGMERHEVLYGRPPIDPAKKYSTVTMWALEENDGNWEESADYFDFEIVYVLAPYRLRNYNSAMARLTTLGLVNCGWMAALRHLLPGDYEYPDLMKRPIDGPNKLGNYMLAAAEWVVRVDECRFVYRECSKRERIPEVYRAMWSMERWREWKKQFGFVHGDERFKEEYRDVAGRAYRMMDEVENENMHSG